MTHTQQDGLVVGKVTDHRFEQHPGAAPATGNTARDQEMYAAGIRTGEDNAKHNAAIRAGVPDGWKLLAKKTCYVLMHDGAVIATLAGPESEANAAIIARMLAAPGVSTVEDALRQCAIKYLTWLGVSNPAAGLEKDLRDPEMVARPLSSALTTQKDWKAIDAAVAEYLDGYEMEGDGGYYVPNKRERAILDDAIAGLLADADFLVLITGGAAPAAGDAQVLAALKQAHMALIGFMPQHRNSVIVSAIVAAREAIDAELAAQRKGDA